METLHRQGLNGLALKDITDAAGLPKGSFYNYFESKEALALEVIGSGFMWLRPGCPENGRLPSIGARSA